MVTVPFYDDMMVLVSFWLSAAGHKKARQHILAPGLMVGEIIRLRQRRRKQGAVMHPAHRSAREYSIRPHRKFLLSSVWNLLFILNASFPAMLVS
jgi:hypothetical protein